VPSFAKYRPFPNLWSNVCINELLELNLRRLDAGSTTGGLQSRYRTRKTGAFSCFWRTNQLRDLWPWAPVRQSRPPRYSHIIHRFSTASPYSPAILCPHEHTLCNGNFEHSSFSGSCHNLRQSLLDCCAGLRHRPAASG